MSIARVAARCPRCWRVQRRNVAAGSISGRVTSLDDVARPRRDGPAGLRPEHRSVCRDGHGGQQWLLLGQPARRLVRGPDAEHAGLHQRDLGQHPVLRSLRRRRDHADHRGNQSGHGRQLRARSGRPDCGAGHRLGHGPRDPQRHRELHRPGRQPPVHDGEDRCQRELPQRRRHGDGERLRGTQNTLGYRNEVFDNIHCTLDCDDPVDVGTPIAVTLGATKTGIDFALDLGGRITGTVTSLGIPVAAPGIEVDIFDVTRESLSTRLKPTRRATTRPVDCRRVLTTPRRPTASAWSTSCTTTSRASAAPATALRNADTGYRGRDRVRNQLLPAAGRNHHRHGDERRHRRPAGERVRRHLLLERHLRGRRQHQRVRCLLSRRTDGFLLRHIFNTPASRISSTTTGRASTEPVG